MAVVSMKAAVQHAYVECGSALNVNAVIVCGVRKAPLFRVVQGGIEIRCKSCRGEWHLIRREDIERLWEELGSTKSQPYLAS